MGGDAAGNRYYENRVDYPFGQHRWVEPGKFHGPLSLTWVTVLLQGMIRDVR